MFLLVLVLGIALGAFLTALLRVKHQEIYTVSRVIAGVLGVIGYAIAFRRLYRKRRAGKTR
jgi:hypothetical protein